MYKVLIHRNQFFSDEFTIGDVIKHFAERADLKTPSADMLFFCDAKYQPKGRFLKGVITKQMADEFVSTGIDFSEKACDHIDSEYKVIKEQDVDKFVRQICPQDTPVLNDDGVPVYMIMKGYIKTERSEHFICRVLSGLSDYNLSVNADMSVSCNCMLRKGGEIGNLNVQTLREIYDGEVACSIRNGLLNGFLPTVSCVMRCDEIRQVSKSYAMYYLRHYNIPKTLMVESTSACNLNCVGCFNKYIEKNTTTLEEVRRIAVECKNNGIMRIDLFKYGEPFLDRDLGKKIDIIQQYNPHINIVTSTNGVLLDWNDNFTNALKLNRIYFSFDGVDNDTLLKFQKNSSFERVYANICHLVKLRNEKKTNTLTIIWKYVLFAHNDSDEMIDKLFQLAETAGVDEVQLVKGFNAEEISAAMWKSDVFLKYMEKYDFSFNLTNNYTFYLRRGK